MAVNFVVTCLGRQNVPFKGQTQNSAALVAYAQHPGSIHNHSTVEHHPGIVLVASGALDRIITGTCPESDGQVSGQ
jgi:hypothetical protein